MSNVNKVKLMSERTSGHFSLSLYRITFTNDSTTTPLHNITLNIALHYVAYLPLCWSSAVQFNSVHRIVMHSYSVYCIAMHSYSVGVCTLLHTIYNEHQQIWAE